MAESEIAEWKLESMVRGYAATALWSSNDTVDGEDVNLDDGRDSSDISKVVMDKMIEDCHEFLKKTITMIEDEDLRRMPEGDIYSSAGHDFWLTRCGHGAGFWDGDWPKYGDKLTEISEAFGNIDLYISDDGMIYA